MRVVVAGLIGAGGAPALPSEENEAGGEYAAGLATAWGGVEEGRAGLVKALEGLEPLELIILAVGGYGAKEQGISLARSRTPQRGLLNGAQRHILPQRLAQACAVTARAEEWELTREPDRTGRSLGEVEERQRVALQRRGRSGKKAQWALDESVR